MKDHRGSRTLYNLQFLAGKSIVNKNLYEYVQMIRYSLAAHVNLKYSQNTYSLNKGRYWQVSRGLNRDIEIELFLKKRQSCLIVFCRSRCNGYNLYE